MINQELLSFYEQLLLICMQHNLTKEVKMINEIIDRIKNNDKIN